LKFLSLTINEGDDECDCHCAEWIENVGVDGDDAERTFDEGGHVLQNEREPPADDEGDQAVVGDVVEIVLADAVTFGAFFGEVDADPCGKDEQDHVPGRREEVAKECDHFILGFVRCVCGAGLRTWDRQ